jgi:LPPG:FO 2-phospho-L-lactate transferase
VKVSVLSGGGGGARFARGVADVLSPGELTVVCNVGDDVEILGLHVSPDVDGVLYALAGLGDETRGWGRGGETWNALESVGFWGGDDWFKLGDRDLGLHLVRTSRLESGRPLSQVTRDLAARAGFSTTVLPATDDRLRTLVVTPAGRFGFQEWYVGRAHRDEVDAVEYEAADLARPAPGVLDAIESADAILIAPSNPYLSIGPILAISAVRSALERRRARCVAVSPLSRGRAITGPLDRMLSRMAGGTSVARLAQLYSGLVDVLVVDEGDADEGAGIETASAQIVMRDRDGARALARRVLEVACA